ncbi:flavoprotein [Nonomuraea sp. NPDC001699]
MTADAVNPRETAAPARPPAFSCARLLLIGTGSIGVANLPFWLSWLRVSYPRLDCRTVVTRSAEKFVTRAALTALSGREALSDQWSDQWSDDAETGARHVEWAQWPDAVIVWPATFQFLARLALGLADTPSLLALQCTTVPVGLALSLPPGGWESPALRAHVRTLTERPNVVVLPPRPGISLTTDRRDGGAAVPLPTLVRCLEERLGRRQADPQVPPR